MSSEQQGISGLSGASIRAYVLAPFLSALAAVLAADGLECAVWHEVTGSTCLHPSLHLCLLLTVSPAPCYNQDACVVFSLSFTFEVWETIVSITFNSEVLC